MNVTYEINAELDAAELAGFYERLGHATGATPAQLARMVDNSAVFVAARDDGRLVGIARGVCDGLRGYLSECKLDPIYQGPAAVTKTDGRVEHDTYGIAAAMARQVLDAFRKDGIERVDVLAWGTEVDFCEELGFKRGGGLVAMTLRSAAVSPTAQPAVSGAAAT
jgi:hypothetical protein